MQNHKKLLDSILDFIAKCKSIDWIDNNNQIECKIIFDQKSFELLQVIEDEGAVNKIIKDGTAFLIKNIISSELKKDEFIVLIHLPKSEKLYFAKDIKDLLYSKINRYHTPSIYYVYSESYGNILENKVTKKIQDYCSTINIIELIFSISDHVDKTGPERTSIFLCKHKLEIPIDYEAENLVHSQLYTTFIKNFDSEPHIEQKIIILKNTIYDFVCNIPSKERLKNILDNFDFIIERYNDNYQLFISDISTETLTLELEAKKLEYVEKIHKIISDIQNKILTIPAALLILFTQFNHSGNEIIKNSGLLLTNLIFIIFIHLMLNNQEKALQSIIESVSSKKSFYRKKYGSIFSNFKEIFNSIEERYINQNKIISIIRFIAYSSFWTSIIYFLHIYDKLNWLIKIFISQLK
ncbi:MAG: hypothetical protein ACEPO8_08260 [Rhodothermaceae bacterium]